jgi:hypothetical protein
MPGPLGNYLGWALANQVNQNPMTSYYEGMKASALPNQMALQSAQAEKAITELEQERQLKSAMAGADLSTDEGLKSAMTKVAPIDPMAALKLRTILSDVEVQKRKALAETINMGAQFVKSNVDSWRNNFPGYVKGRRMAIELNPLVGMNLPEPQQFMNKDGSINMSAFNEAIMNIGHGAEVAKNMFKPPPKPDVEFVGEDKQRQRFFKGHDASGQPIYEYGPTVPRWKPEGEMAVEVLPDHTVRVTKGGKGTGSPTGVTQKTQGVIEAGLENALSFNRSIADIESRFDPSFLTYKGQAKNWWQGVQEKAGFTLSEEDKKTKEKFTAFRAEAAQFFADRLKAMSGTAVTEQEMQRQRAYLPDPQGDSPTELNAKIKRFKEFNTRAIARLNYIRRFGFSIENVGLDKIPDIMHNYANEIAEKKYGVKPGQRPSPEIQKQVAIDTATFFGLTGPGQ